MDNVDLRARRTPPDYRDAPLRRTRDAHDPHRDRPDGYTLMVAGRPTGKTSFLRLLLDTSLVAPDATQDQLAAVARFVQGCAGHTSHIRSVSVAVDQPVPNDDGVQELHTLNLTLIDTPALDFADEQAAQRVVQDILLHLDARFEDSVQDERQAYAGDHHVHLCVYFIDPDEIVPPAVALPPAPLVARARNGSLSKPDPEPVILEPPVATNPLLTRPSLPQSDISTIRRLSARVNVLPVIARADVLSNDRLAAVKIAVRRDLAAAGIGFGIFDGDAASLFPYAPDASDAAVPRLSVPGDVHAFGGGGPAPASAPNGPSAHSPPGTPLAPSLLRLPFALISPDMYAHSDGVTRPGLQRHELVHQYTPAPHRGGAHALAAKVARGRFVRSYRWGTLDCMDINHCDFLHLRSAIFYHMRTLQKYTREYLLEKFRLDCQLPPPPLPHTAPQRASPVVARLPPVASSHGTRPILAIDTAPNPPPSRPASHSISHSGDSGLSSGRTAVNSDPSPVAAASTLGTQQQQQQQRVRTKKINVACNFCRSRKLKCDGGRPACSQCFKRSHPCDYTPNSKRRGGKRRKSDDGSSDELDLDLDAADAPTDDTTEHSPEVLERAHERRNSAPLPPMQGLPPLVREYKHELPPIATLPVPHAPEHGEMGHTLAPLRAPDMPPQHAPARRRASSAASNKQRQNGYGSKIVACNFCRARKTRCDGGHPACGSCARRSLPCNYVNDPAAGNPKGRPKALPPSAAGPSAPPSGRASPSPLAGIPNGFIHHIHADEYERDVAPPMKKMRIDEGVRVPVGVGAQD